MHLYNLQQGLLTESVSVRSTALPCRYGTRCGGISSCVVRTWMQVTCWFIGVAQPQPAQALAAQTLMHLRNSMRPNCTHSSLRRRGWVGGPK